MSNDHLINWVEEGQFLGVKISVVDAERLSKQPHEKLVRDVFDYLPHRVADPGEGYALLTAKLDEEYTEVRDALEVITAPQVADWRTYIGKPELISELADLVEVCYALGGREAVEKARLAKLAERGGFDKLLVMRLEDLTDK